MMRRDFDIGFLGGGQLARMSIQAAQRMGLRCLSLDSDESSPASQIAPSIQGKLGDVEKLAEVFARCERVTLENEFVPADRLRMAVTMAHRTDEAMLPGIEMLERIQDKLKQRSAYRAAGVPSPRAVALEGSGETAVVEIGFPMVLKARFGGYDGKGTRYANDAGELEAYRDLWSSGGWLAEEFVSFQRELAVMVYACPDETGAFPTMETVQVNHVCDLVFPANRDAAQIAIDAVAAVNGQGLFGVELFELETGELSVNEIAPRPHNSGHYSLDWGGVSQFEQHVRLAMGYPPMTPLGGPCCMANLLGQSDHDDFRAGIHAALDVPDVYVHWYGKQVSRVGRKMGHINATGEGCVERARLAREMFYAAAIH